MVFFSYLSALFWHVIHETTWKFTPFSPPPLQPIRKLLNKIVQNTLQLTIAITIKGAVKISVVFPKEIHFSAINTTSWEFTDAAVDFLQWGNKLYLVLISSFQRTNQSIVNINRSPTHLTSQNSDVTSTIRTRIIERTNHKLNYPWRRHTSLVNWHSRFLLF